MERYKKYLHRTLRADRLADRDSIVGMGFRERWVPDELEAFDEVELAIPLDDERDLLVTLAVEETKIERMLLGHAPAGDDDADAEGLTEDGLTAALEQHGDVVARLLAFLTGI
jgi:hypothetical protein